MRTNDQSEHRGHRTISGTLKPIVDLRPRFLQDGILVGFDLKSADLRILHHNLAMNELAASREGRLRTPVIVYERIDSAVIHNDPQVRSLLASEDVKLWLKLNSLRDHHLNNEPFLAEAYHYRVLNEFPDLHIDDSNRDARCRLHRK